MNFLGFYCFVAAVVVAALRNEILLREADAQWVRDWMDKAS